jgi:pyridoxal phosphate enzyme (YggS family)
MFNTDTYYRLRKTIPSRVKILAASKGKSIEDITKALESGIIIIGESYVQEAEEKYLKLNDLFREKNVELHMIGHLQSNKIQKAVRIFDCIQSVDSVKAAEIINKECEKNQKKIDVFIEVNMDKDKKAGVDESKLSELVEKIRLLNNLNLKGLMSIPKIGKEDECFKKMNELKIKFGLNELSIGMSNDYEKAIENGATIIRLGTLLFGRREKIDM